MVKASLHKEFMQEIKIYDSVLDLADEFDGFIVDLWGVIHDGSELYPNVIDTLKKFEAKNKKILFLSNAPRRKSAAEKRLLDFGIARDLFLDVLTSGEVAHEWLAKQTEFEKTYTYVGPDRDLPIMEGLNYKKVNSAKDAGIMMVTGFDHDDSEMQEKIPFLEDAIKYNLPFICANPDIEIVRRNGKRALCAGALAEEYEKMGGKVIYFGKPHFDVYKKSFEILGILKNRIAAIGDNLDTDIKGANENNIYSVVVTSGVLAEPLRLSYGQKPDEKALNRLCQEKGIIPNAAASCFI